MKITISKENYLKAIAEAESEGETVKAVILSRWLHVSAPAVTMATRRLKRDGLIQVAQEGQIRLTAAGREIASRLLNRHHLIERMLTEIFELDRAPQPERNLPTIWLTQAHVGRRWIGTQLPVVEVPHQMAFAVELDLDG